MKSEYDIRKLLAKIKRDEKEWRNTAESGADQAAIAAAQENLSKVDGVRQSLLKELAIVQRRKEHVMRVAVAEGIYTDHMSDGVCQQLRDDGWLEQAASITGRRHVSRDQAYLPTDKAIDAWKEPVAE